MRFAAIVFMNIIYYDVRAPSRHWMNQVRGNQMKTTHIQQLMRMKILYARGRKCSMTSQNHRAQTLKIIYDSSPNPTCMYFYFVLVVCSIHGYMRRKKEFAVLFLRSVYLPYVSCIPLTVTMSMAMTMLMIGDIDVWKKQTFYASRFSDFQ